MKVKARWNEHEGRNKNCAPVKNSNENTMHIHRFIWTVIVHPQSAPMTRENKNNKTY